MWKTFSRGFRETFERGLGISLNNTSRVHNETQKTKYYQYSKPASCVDHYLKRTGCRQGCNDKERAEEEQKHRNYSSNDPFDSWLGAVSCSSAFALGWLLSQPCLWKRWFFSGVGEEKKCKASSLVEYLGKIANSQPLLPPVSAQDIDCAEQTYGPQTSEEAFNEAANNFLEVHNSIFGEVENKQAVALIEGPNKDERKAIRLFFSASKKGYVPAAYNLGQCYELGVGTKQDFHEAAKWYRKAANAGHPTATYNLAVFHAHGWGGLESDVNKARELLKTAASLGQPDAAAALGLNNTQQSIPGVPEEVVEEKESLVQLLVDDKMDSDQHYRHPTAVQHSPCSITSPISYYLNQTLLILPLHLQSASANPYNLGFVHSRE